MSSSLSSFKTIFDTKGRFHVRQLEVGEADVRNEVRVGLYDESDHCVGNVTLRVDPKNGEPLFVITTGGDGYFEKKGPLVVVAPTRPYTEAVMLLDPSAGVAPSNGISRMRVSSEDDARRIAQLEHERDVLGKAIRDIAVAAGICRDDVPLTGPDLLMLCNDIKNAMGEPPQAPAMPALHLATHEHRHGEDNYLFTFEPSDEEVIAAINARSSYEPDQGERFSVNAISAISRDAFIGEPKAPRPKG